MYTKSTAPFFYGLLVPPIISSARYNAHAISRIDQEGSWQDYWNNTSFTDLTMYTTLKVSSANSERRQPEVKRRSFTGSFIPSNNTCIYSLATQAEEPQYDVIQPCHRGTNKELSSCNWVPPVPPRAYKEGEVVRPERNVEPRHDEVKDAPHTCRAEKLTINQVGELYRDKLPIKLCINAGAGIYGTDKYSTFSEADELTMHFLRRMDYVVLQTQQNQQYHVPLASTALFAPFYNPHKQAKTAMAGYIFNSPGMLIDSNPRPQFIAVISSSGHDSNTESVAFCTGDILAIIEREENMGKKKHLKCINIRTGEYVMLQKSMMARFTTKPSQLMMQLDLFFEYSTAFPVQVIIKIPTSAAYTRMIPVDEVMTLLHRGHSTLAVCSRKFFTEAADTIFDLPLDFSLDVGIVTMEDIELEQLRHLTSDIYHSLDFEMVDYHLLAAHTSSLIPCTCKADIQQAFFKMVDSCELRKHCICPQGISGDNAPIKSTDEGPDRAKEELEPSRPVPVPIEEHEPEASANVEVRLKVLECCFDQLKEELDAVKETVMRLEKMSKEEKQMKNQGQ